MKRNRSSIVRPSVAVRVLLTVGIVWGLGCFPSVIADDIVVTGSAQADGLLSSLRLSFSAHAAPTRLFLAWGVENSGDSLGNWEHVDWLADVPAGATSCDAPVPTLHSGLPFVRIFRIAPDDSITELESVTATGTQYVKTGFTPTAKTAVRCDFTLDAFSSQAIFGARSGTGQNSLCLLTIVPGNGGHGWRFDYGQQIKNSGVDPVAARRYLAEADYHGLKIDGTLLSEATVGSPATVSPGCVMALFGMNTAGAVGSPAKATIYSFKAWSDSDNKTTTLSADLVPCRKNGVVSFYNRANGTFESLVTGTLAGGAEAAHGTCGTVAGTSPVFNPYGTDRTMTVSKFYRDHSQPTADLSFTAGLADCTLVATHDSVDHGGVLADWPAENAAILAVVPATTTSMTVTVPYPIEDGEARYFRFFLLARSGSAIYDRQFEGIRATGTQYVLTDFVPTETANVMANFKFDAIADAQAIFGARQAAYKRSFAVLHTYDNGYRFDYCDWLENSHRRADYERHVVNAYSSGLEVDGSRFVTVPDESKWPFTTPCPLAVFGLNTAGTVGAFAKGVCRDVKAWRVAGQENTRVLDLLPAMKNGEVGFYNKCDGKFYGNSGTGAFEAVGEVVNVTAQVLADSGTRTTPPPGGLQIFVR